MSSPNLAPIRSGGIVLGEAIVVEPWIVTSIMVLILSCLSKYGKGPWGKCYNKIYLCLAKNEGTEENMDTTFWGEYGLFCSFRRLIQGLEAQF